MTSLPCICLGYHKDARGWIFLIEESREECNFIEWPRSRYWTGWGLSSSSLIEEWVRFDILGASVVVNSIIRGMRFVFEVNQKSVRRYLANVAKKGQVKSTNFEWSPNGVP
ncbi:hypothetical protein CK203_006112 [Vitis vinifera]|uniref:Uncharacterized protein n=1 Tax=Vitis vinifera TaxID=29760 RepID=A0A438K5F7_VITVI|nr:hypothetical protein CK203_006112 [Vitis vinifera]